jgi:hypothetical protein
MPHWVSTPSTRGRMIIRPYMPKRVFHSWSIRQLFSARFGAKKYVRFAGGNADLCLLTYHQSPGSLRMVSSSSSLMDMLNI